MDTRAQELDGAFGDGILVQTYPGEPRATATVDRSRIERSARAGIANFGADIQLGDTTLECNPIDLDGEPSGSSSYAYVDAAHNACGCESERGSCTILSEGLTPPEPLPPP